MKIRTCDSNAKPFDLIPAITREVTGVSEIRIPILVPNPEMHRVPTFSAPTPSVPEEGFSLTGKILLLYLETYTGLTFDAPTRASSVARGNENLDAGLECKAFKPNSDNIRLQEFLKSVIIFLPLDATGDYFRCP
ncbi:hypothetical protein TNCV_3372581 [Trichonephila clavipes]|nr:hypothetical protein TNCV_3372581 [Trichonephila clavipes]